MSACVHSVSETGCLHPWWPFYYRKLLPRGLNPSPIWWQRCCLYPALLIPCIFAGASGWLVGRCHRAHREAMVLIYLLSVQLWLFCQGAGSGLGRRFLGIADSFPTFSRGLRISFSSPLPHCWADYGEPLANRPSRLIDSGCDSVIGALATLNSIAFPRTGLVTRLA